MPKPPTSPTEKPSPPASRPTSVKPLPLLPDRPALRPVTVPAVTPATSPAAPRPLQLPVPPSQTEKVAELPARPSPQAAKSLSLPRREPAQNTPLTLPERPQGSAATVSTLPPSSGPPQNGVQRPLPGVVAPSQGSGRLELPERRVEPAGGLRMLTPLPGRPGRPSDVSTKHQGDTVAAQRQSLQLPERPQVSHSQFRMPESPKPTERPQDVAGLLGEILRELQTKGDDAAGVMRQPIDIARPLWGDR